MANIAGFLWQEH